jgi:hypothetical protein
MAHKRKQRTMNRAGKQIEAQMTQVSGSLITPVACDWFVDSTGGL